MFDDGLRGQKRAQSIQIHYFIKLLSSPKRQYGLWQKEEYLKLYHWRKNHIGRPCSNPTGSTMRRKWPTKPQYISDGWGKIPRGMVMMCILLIILEWVKKKQPRGLMLMCILQHHTYEDIIVGWPSCSAAKYRRIPGVAEKSHRMVAAPSRIHIIWDLLGMYAHICKPFILPSQVSRWLAMAIRTVSYPESRSISCLCSCVISDGDH